MTPVVGNERGAIHRGPVGVAVKRPVEVWAPPVAGPDQPGRRDADKVAAAQPGDRMSDLPAGREFGHLCSADDLFVPDQRLY